MVAHSKILLAGIISGIVALTTTLLGVTGTVIGSVLASLIYTFLSESLENKVEKKYINTFEKEIIYLFPLIIIAIIDFILIMALFLQLNLLGHDFTATYLYLQELANYNLYRILGFSTLLISIYPMFLKSKKINTNQSMLLIFVGLVFLLKGFIDLNNPIVYLYSEPFLAVDLFLNLIGFGILIYLIIVLSYNAYNSGKIIKKTKTKKINHNDSDDFVLKKPNYSINIPEKSKQANSEDEALINKSSDDIEFVSNNLLNNKKRK